MPDKLYSVTACVPGHDPPVQAGVHRLHQTCPNTCVGHRMQSLTALSLSCPFFPKEFFASSQHRDQTSSPSPLSFGKPPLDPS